MDVEPTPEGEEGRERGEKKEIDIHRDMELGLNFSNTSGLGMVRYCAVNCGGLLRCGAAGSGMPVLEYQY